MNIHKQVATTALLLMLFAIVGAAIVGLTYDNTLEDNEIKKTETLIPPPHEPGVLPAWLHEKGAAVVIAGGMGNRAINLFNQNGIKVITGAPAIEPEKLVESYLTNTLQSGANLCDH